MKKVGLTRSIHLKFVLIYVLLILLAMQIIGVYFVRELEQKLVENFKTSITNRVNLLEYTVKEAMLKKRSEDDPTLQEDIYRILDDSSKTSDIAEIRVINNRSRIEGTSDPNNQGLVGQMSSEKK